MAANGPLPSHLTFLNSLPSHPTGTKVRFLGCVTAYSVYHGLLELSHSYPSTSASSSNVRAMVDVTVIVETMGRADHEVGAWVNVVGYVQKSSGKGTGLVRVWVQAVTVWSAGAVRVGGI